MSPVRGDMSLNTRYTMEFPMIGDASTYIYKSDTHDTDT